MNISRPIILTGSGRSGSTVVYEALAMHEDLGWWSNFAVSLPRVVASSTAFRCCRLLGLEDLVRTEKRQHKQGLFSSNRFLIRPDECFPLWGRCVGAKFGRGYLIGVSASPDERRKVRRAVSWALRVLGKPRFIAKITGPTRLTYLRSIFPDAIFIHVVRDGRAVVKSLLNVDFWKKGGGYDRPWWDNGLPDDWQAEWERYAKSPMALAAIQWRTILDVADREKAEVPPDQYLEIRYEDFVADPPEVTSQVLAFCGLNPSARVSLHVGQPGKYSSMNQKYREAFSEEEIKSMECIMGRWLEHFGYMGGET